MSHQSDLISEDILAYLAQHERKELLRFLTCGNVDDGKSTLIGRLLHDSKMIYEDHLEAITRDSKKVGTTGEEVDLALLVDGLQAEREQGITIDVAYRYFSTAKRKFIIADTPGHEQYTRNMVTGASTCDLAIILVDARYGVQTQTRRHSYIASLLGIKHIVVAVNKMDLKGFDQDVFESIKADYLKFAEAINLTPSSLHFVPMSALKGDNVVNHSERSPWYAGPTLMEILETVEVSADRNFTDLRFPVQYVNRPNLNFRGFAGTIASGVVHKGDDNTLVINARGKRGGTDYLRLGLNLSDDMRGDSAFNLGASYRVNGINRLGAEWLTRAQIGDQQELYSEFYQPLDVGSRYFVAPYLDFGSQNIEATLDNDPVAEYRLERYGFGLNLGRQIGTYGEVRVGVGKAWGEAEVRIGDQDLPSVSFNEGFYELKYSFDTFDNVYFPHSGEDIGLALRKYDKSLDSDDDYRQWELKLDKAFSSGPHSLVLGGRYGRTLDDAQVVTSSFVFGGARQLSGFRQDSVSGQNISLMRMVYYRRLTPRAYLPLDFPLYLGGSLERGRAWNNDNEFDSGYINAASIFLGLETPLGPLNISYGANDEHQKAVYLNLGHTF